MTRDEDLHTVISAAFERIRANILRRVTEPGALRRALNTLDALHREVDKDPVWVRKILKQMESKNPKAH